MKNLDRILWVLMLLPYIAVIGLVLYVRLKPILRTLHKYGNWWPKILLIGQQLVKDDERPMHFNLLRIAGFLAFVVVGGKWILYWWPAGPEAAQEVDSLFIANLIVILIYLVIIVAGTTLEYQTSSAQGLWEFTKDLLYRLFVPEDRDFPKEFVLWALLLAPSILNMANAWFDADAVKARVVYASINHHAEVAKDPSKIYRVHLNDLTRTLCSRAMNGSGIEFAEEGAKNPYHAQYYARCVVLIQRPLLQK
jgi:hypothetical protein